MEKASTPAPLEDERIIEIIQQALRKQGTCYFQTRVFTGDIVKYDQERRQLIVKILKEYVHDYSISEIQKISFNPNNIRIPTKERFNPLSFLLYSNSFYFASSFE